MTLEKYGAILTELEAMENWYETECELAGKADIPMPNYYDFKEDGLNRIAQRQEVEVEVVRRIYNKTRNKG